MGLVSPGLAPGTATIGLGHIASTQSGARGTIPRVQLRGGNCWKHVLEIASVPRQYGSALHLHSGN